MSRYNRQGNCSTPGKSDGRIKHTNANSRTEWKLKPKIDASLDSATDVKDLKSTPFSLHDVCNSKNVEQFGGKCASDVKNPKPKIDASLDSASDVKNLKPTPISLCDDGNSKNLKQSGEKSQNYDVDVAFDKPVLNLLDDDGDSKKVKQLGDKSQNNDYDANERLTHPRFDICPKRISSVPKLKPPLHVTNKQKRNQMKQSLTGQNISILRPGMVLMKGYISSADQISIVKTCRELGISVGGFYQPGYSGETKLHLKMMCLGKNWDPESKKYTELRPFDKSKPPGIPEKFHDVVKKAIHDSNKHIREKVGSLDEGKVVPNMSPDICIVNFYSKTGRLGLHQDKDESEKSLKKGLPVVSFSIGDSAEFLYGDTRAVDEAEKVTLESGDVLIFGGKSRLIYHGVTSIIPDTAPAFIEATDLLPGRLNLTFRMY